MTKTNGRGPNKRWARHDSAPHDPRSEGSHTGAEGKKRENLIGLQRGEGRGEEKEKNYMLGERHCRKNGKRGRKTKNKSNEIYLRNVYHLA